MGSVVANIIILRMYATHHDLLKYDISCMLQVLSLQVFSWFAMASQLPRGPGCPRNVPGEP